MIPAITEPTSIDALDDEALAALLMHRGSCVDAEQGERMMEHLMSGDPERMAAVALELTQALGFEATIDVDGSSVSLTSVSPARLVEHLEKHIPSNASGSTIADMTQSGEPLQIVRGLRLALHALSIAVVAMPSDSDASAADTIPISTNEVH